MIFFGWGRKNKIWLLGENKIIATWSYFSIFFCPIAFNIQWHLLGNNRNEDRTISKEELKSIIPLETPSVNLWQRYGLVFLIAIIFIINAF